MKLSINIGQRLRNSSMNTKTLLGALALAGLFAGRAQAQITVTTVLSNGLAEPYGVVVDGANNIFLSDSVNNRIVRIDVNTQAATTLAGLPDQLPGFDDGPAYLATFNDPQGLLVATNAGDYGLLVCDSGNNAIRFVRFSDGDVTTVAGLDGSLNYPVGLTQDGNGNVYIGDSDNNVIRVLKLSDHSVTTLIITGTTLYRPTALAFAGTNQLWIADTGNQMIKLATLSDSTHGTLTTLLGGNHVVGTTDSAFGPNARFNGPSGLLWLEGVGLLISDTLNNSVRLATNYPAFGVSNYAVTTIAGTPGQAGYVDGAALSAKLNSPYGLAQDLINNGFLVADLKNNAIRRIQTGPALPPVVAPQIGWVDYQKDVFGDLVSVLRTAQPFVFINDENIQIISAQGSLTFFNFGPTPPNSLQDTIPVPPNAQSQQPPAYRDGLHPFEVPASMITIHPPDFTIKAVSTQVGRPNSTVTQARFQFRTADPGISGDNAASFVVVDQTTNAVMWYTLDGSDPTNSPPSIGPITSPAQLSFNITTDLTFKVRAFRDNYIPSDTVTKIFSPTNFTPNRISFGFAAGEASSDFVASPGQLFYAPVTLSILSGTKVDSLQFNLTATNGGPNPGPTLQNLVNTLFGFQSFLVKPNPQPPNFVTIPTAMMLPYTTNTTVTCDTNIFCFTNGATVTCTTNVFCITNILGVQPNPPPPTNLVFTYGGQQFMNLQFVDGPNNLMGVGWLERAGKTNLYDTRVQDLIKYSQPHDTTFLEDGGNIVLGGYEFLIPPNAAAGQTYQIQIGRPSATSDGIGAPGSAVYIATPTNGSLAGGALNAVKNVTVGQRKYTVGDAAPFRWFNAGDFGDTNLDNSDVMQVFEAAVYNLDSPPPGSDFFDAMDSCGSYGVTNAGAGYWVSTTPLDTNQVNALFCGDDTSINCVAFGDGVLDVCDVFVTFRRSLDPSLWWFQRFWTNGVRAALPIGNPPPNQPFPGGGTCTTNCSSLIEVSVSFATSDSQASPGQTLQIPVTAQILGNYPLKVLGLNLSVVPLDGSPAISTPVQFSPNPILGQPTISASKGNGNYTATWLNSSISGLTGNATLGTLTVQVPSNAISSSAYAVHFDHASASPNGLASFPKQTKTALITLADRSTSSFGDGIPDSWRLRYFGTVNNVLSQASADADGDGASNWQEYVAGTDPTDPKSCLRASTHQAVAQQKQDCVIHWPSVSGKTYIIERATSVFAPNWSAIATNTGTGADMEYHDTAGGNVRFYRVHVQ